MAHFGERTRFVVLLSAGIALLVVGIMLGAAGRGFIIGQDNDAGSRDTSLTARTDGNAFLITQYGNGAAIRGSTGSGGGTAGFFTSGGGFGVVGVVSGRHGYGMYAANDAAATGRGGALRAEGKANVGIIVTSDAASAVVASVTAGHGSAVVATDASPERDAFALVAAGDVVVDGSLAAVDGCVGCTSVEIARNASGDGLVQGAAVAIRSLEVGQDGSTILVVEPAAVGEPVIGLVDRAVSDPIAGPSGVVKWVAGQPTVAPGATMRIVTGGILTVSTPPAGAVVGGRLVVIGPSGRIGPVAADAAAIGAVGVYLGPRPDGAAAILVDPD